jgi:hypothetical protein
MASQYSRSEPWIKVSKQGVCLARHGAQYYILFVQFRLTLCYYPGYWPDGIYTAPTYEAMTYDIKTLKHLGYNMLRKHVEPPLYYAAADEIGILIMQDMPNLAPQRWPNEAEQTEFQRQLEVIVTQLRSYESIFAWVSVKSQTWSNCDRVSFPANNILDADDL